MHCLELDHFGVDVSDLARAERFYTGIGLQVASALANIKCCYAAVDKCLRSLAGEICRRE
jgi:hypothetical protein